MNKPLLQQQEGTVSAGNSSTPASVPGALTGKGKMPPPKCHGWGQMWGNPIRGGVATGVCGRERQFKPHSNTDMDPLRGRTALRQQGSPEGRDRPGLSEAQEPGHLQCQGARSKGGFAPTCGVEGGRRAATRRVKVN